MKPFRPIAPVPEGYFETLRGMLSDAAFTSLSADITMRTGDFSAIRFHNDGQVSYLRSLESYSADQARAKAIATATIALHSLIAEANPAVTTCNELSVTLKATDLPVIETGRRYFFHNDFSPSYTSWVGYLACDQFGTVYRSRFRRQPRSMPAQTINEFYPHTEHSSPSTNSQHSFPRTFVRFIYHWPADKSK